MRFKEISEGLRDPKDNPCWKGYKPVGTKQKDGRTVPNCVPKEGVAEGSVNDYFKRRKDEEDRIAGIKAPAKRSPRQTDYAKRRAQEKKVDQGVAEGYAGADDTDTVGFHLDSERAYQAVMDRFGHLIDHDETSGIMYAPARVWPQIEMVAFDADGVGAQRDDDLENPEHYGVAEGYNDISVGDYVSYDDGPGTDRWEVVSIQGNRVELRNEQGGTTFADINDVLKEQGVAEGPDLGAVRTEDNVVEAAGLYGPFTATINTGERPRSRTKTKKFKREDDAILWAEDWLENFPQYSLATAEVADPEGNVVWTTDESLEESNAVDELNPINKFALKKIRAKHPQAKSEFDALIADLEQGQQQDRSDIGRLDNENDQEEVEIDRLDSENDQDDARLDRLEQELAAIKRLIK